MDTKQPYPDDERRWQAVVERDRGADGRFYYGVKTTGIFCRPSCSSRLPKRHNVEFFRTIEAAETGGYRACRRCRPGTASKEQQLEKKIVAACRRIEASEGPLTLAELAQGAGLSPSYFQRLFKRLVGVSPKQYAAAHRSRRFKEQLQTGSPVTEAIYAAGFSSTSGAYDKEKDQLAMLPKEYRAGGAGVSIHYGIAQSFLGWVIVASTEKGVCAIEFGEEPSSLPGQLRRRFPQARLQQGEAGFAVLLQEVIAGINAPARGIDLPLDIQGTVFQQQVWESLRRIQPGETRSYSEVAREIGRPRAVRAVASACAANKLAVAIPCHRVVAKGGGLGGYRWGVERKAQLLAAEHDQGSE